MNKTLYYIQNTEMHDNNLMLFFRIDKQGFTSNLADARLFSERIAKRICRESKHLVAWSDTYLKKNTQLTVSKEFVDRNRAKWKK